MGIILYSWHVQFKVSVSKIKLNLNTVTVLLLYLKFLSYLVIFGPTGKFLSLKLSKDTVDLTFTVPVVF